MLLRRKFAYCLSIMDQSTGADGMHGVHTGESSACAESGDGSMAWNHDTATEICISPSLEEFASARLRELGQALSQLADVIRRATAVATLQSESS